jgi:hypothetical protein
MRASVLRELGSLFEQNYHGINLLSVPGRTESVD